MEEMQMLSLGHFATLNRDFGVTIDEANADMTHDREQCRCEMMTIAQDDVNNVIQRYGYSCNNDVISETLCPTVKLTYGSGEEDCLKSYLEMVCPLHTLILYYQPLTLPVSIITITTNCIFILSFSLYLLP
jgi:hypothetical protein